MNKNQIAAAIDGRNAAAQIKGFQTKTLLPSKGLIGIKLNAASQKLMPAPIRPKFLKNSPGPEAKKSKAKKNPIKILVTGPARLIKPFFFLSM